MQITTPKYLVSDRIRRLENIGFSWTYPWDAIAEKRWESMFDALTKYMKNHGNCNFINRTEESIVLARWANMQRENYQFKRLTDIQIKRLEDIGFIWDTTTIHWEKMLDALKEYKKNHGDCNVPSYWQEENLPLGQWANAQRENFKNLKLNDDQIEILEYIGFAWNPICPIWEKMFNKLKEYKNNNGDCNVPANLVEANLPLGQWVSAQRKNSKNQKHSDTQIKRLKEIGF